MASSKTIEADEISIKGEIEEKKLKVRFFLGTAPKLDNKTRKEQIRMKKRPLKLRISGYKSDNNYKSSSKVSEKTAKLANQSIEEQSYSHKRIKHNVEDIEKQHNGSVLEKQEHEPLVASQQLQPQLVTLDPLDKVPASVWLARSETTLKDAGFPESRFMYQMQRTFTPSSSQATWCIDYMRRMKQDPDLMNYKCFKAEFLFHFQPHDLKDEIIERMNSIKSRNISQYMLEFYDLRSQVEEHTIPDSVWIKAFYQNLPKTNLIFMLRGWKYDREGKGVWQSTTWNQLIKEVRNFY